MIHVNYEETQMMHMRKVMKTIGICSMAAIMMAGISGCGGKTGGAVSSGAKNAAKIGFTAALTGGAAAYGKSEEEGFPDRSLGGGYEGCSGGLDECDEEADPGESIDDHRADDIQ